MWGISQKPRHLENFPDTQVFGKFLKHFKYTTIRFQQKFRESEEFPRYPDILKICILKNFVNFSNDSIFGEFPKNPGI